MEHIKSLYFIQAEQLNDLTSLEFDGLEFMISRSFPLYNATAVDAFSCLWLLFDFPASRLSFGTGNFVVPLK